MSCCEGVIFKEQLPALSKEPLVQQKIEPGDMGELLNEFL